MRAAILVLIVDNHFVLREACVGALAISTATERNFGVT
jgi:hypothetical protein